MLNGYFFQGFILAAVTVFLPSLIGILIVKGCNKKLTLMLSWGAGSVYMFFWTLLNWGSSEGFYAPAPYFFSALFGFAISAGICMFFADNRKAAIPGISGASLILFVITYLSFFSTPDMWGNAKPKAQLIGKVDIITDVDSAMEPADTAHICRVDEEMATVLAQNALSKFKVNGGAIPGSRYEIGSPTKQYVAGQFWWIFPVEFQGWLKWRDDSQVPGYLRVSAEDPYREAEAVQIDRQGKNISIKYLNSACWGYLAKRHLRYNGYMHKILLDWTFEVDDSWVPYYTVTVAERQFGYEGLKVTGVVVVDLQTGESKFYGIDQNIPEWIDRVVPLSVIDYNVKKWGEYSVEGWWYNFWHNDKAQQPTKGWYLAYSKDKAQWFSGFTSMSDNDHAMTGFTLSDARTGKTTFYRATGVTEEKAYHAAAGLWSNFNGYQPAEIVPYNLSGVLTYVITMKYSGQYAGISLVSVENINVKAKGKTLEEALESYRNEIANVAGNNVAPENGEVAQKAAIQGIVERVGMPISKGQDVIFSFMFQGVHKRFQVADSFKNNEAVFLSPGMEVVCEYVNTRSSIVTCSKLDILSIVFTDENPAQAKLLKNEKAVDQEMSRVREGDERERILNSERMKEADPEQLKDFLRNQQKK